MLCSLLGDDRCFLFSVSPRMAVYTCTGYNDHYMYLNQGQQTIPNGLVRMGAGAGRGPRSAVHPLVTAPAPTCPGACAYSSGSVWCPIHPARISGW